MAKKKLTAKIASYGIYDGFDSHSEALPLILHFTTKIPSRIGIEFGYILNITKGRGEKLSFCIDHPPFKNSSGDLAPSFTGEFYVKTADFNFFLGDTIWAPIEDKMGDWVLSVAWNGKTIAKKKFNIVQDDFAQLHSAL